MKKIFFCIVLFFLFLSYSVSCFVLELFVYAHKPNGKYEKRKIIIEQGTGFNTVSKVLNHSKIITNVYFFRLIARLYSYDSKIKAGEYYISPSMSPLIILENFVKGKVVLHKITIPEGYSIKQIADLFESKGLVSREEFMEQVLSPELARELGVFGTSLEGYLFPDTYHFPKGISCKKIIHKMVKSFHLVMKNDWIKRAQEMDMSIHKIITLASIIEKETGQADERPIISSVFHNRLKKNMKLESDPTVIYGIIDFNGNITKKDLRTQTPYNTYRIKGLPPGPIANPGALAISAALFPAKTKYLYFVSKKDGTHYFSTNLKSHTKAVQKYQKSKNGKK